MKFKIQITIDEPFLSEKFKMLGPYKRAIFVKECVRKHLLSDEGKKLFQCLLERKPIFNKQKPEPKGY